ncbi:MAG: hypothetical protein V3W34_01155 [Phycisphaerae bacterium]
MNLLRNTPTLAANGVVLTAVLLMAGAAGPARGQQFIATWIGNGGVWGSSLNWECQGPIFNCLPNNGNPPTYRVFIRHGQLCNLNMSPTVDQIDILFDGASATLNHFNNHTLTIIGGLDPPDPNRTTGVFSLDAATYIMSSTGNNTDLVFTGGPLIIRTGGQPGMIQMSDFTTNRIYAATANEALLIGNNITVEGSGQIGVNQTTITNDGTIRATQTAPLILDPGTGGFANNLFLLADGGTLQLNAGSFDNTNGTISAVSPGSTVMLNGAVVSGGIVQSQFGTFQLNGGSIQNTTLLIQTSGLVSGNTTVGNLTNQGVINHNNNVSGLHVSGTFNNEGAYLLNSIGNNTDLILDADTTLTGGGQIDMSAFTSNRIYGLTGDRRLTNVNNRIHGAGQVGRNQMRLTNSGIIEADENGAPLTIDMVGDASVNSGVFRASAGGILRINADTFDQTLGGLVEALDGSVVELSNPTMIGGTFNTVGTGVVRVIAGSTRLNGAANTGLIEIPNNVTGLRLLSSLANSGTIDMLSVGNNTDLICETDMLLTGGGTINMTNNIANRIYATSGDLTFTNVDNTIRGSGKIGINQTTIVNRGTIIADQPTRLEIDPAAAGGMTNSGLMRAESGGTLELKNAPYDNTTGQMRALTGSTLRLSSGAVITGGTVVAETGGTLQFNGGRTTGTVPVIQAGATGPITAGGGGADGGLNNFGQMAISNNVSGFAIGQTFNNVGTLAMNSTGNNTDLILEADTTLTGGGQIDMSAFTSNRIYGLTGDRRLTNVNNRIHGAGQVGRNQMRLTNSGIIEADENGVRLTIDMAGDVSVNSGVFRASAGGILRIDPDTFDQTLGGLVEALDGSLVELSNPTMIGGTFNTVGTGVVRVIAGSTRLNGAANTGLIEIPNNIAGLRLQGTLANSGTIDLLSIGNNTDIICETDVSLTGGGFINMTDVLTNRIYATSGALTFTNVDNTIRGSGKIGFNQTTIVNQGTIIADQPTRIEIDPGTGGFDNQGDLRAENGAELRLNAGAFTTSGSVLAATASSITRSAADYNQTAGSTIIDGALTLNAGGTVTLNGGSLGGSGQVNADVNNAAGTAAPGASTGILTISGDYTQGPGASMAAEIGGLIPGTEHDVLAVAGTATLAGRLDVSLINGFIPAQLGDTFTILTAASVTGQFDHVASPVFGDSLRLRPVFTPSEVQLVVVPAADLNRDGAVDLLDFSTFTICFTGPGPAVPSSGCDPASFSASDLDSDDDVDLDDYDIFFAAVFGL